MAEKDYVRAYPMHSGRFEVTAKWTSERVTINDDYLKNWQVQACDGMPGGFVSVSSNGDSDGIVWVSVAPQQDATNTIEPGVLLAFNAEDGTFLWVDDQPPTVSFAKFVPPTIAGGKVFRAAFSDPKRQDCPSKKDNDYEGVASCGSIVIYGLRFQGLHGPLPAKNQSVIHAKPH